MKITTTLSGCSRNTYLKTLGLLFKRTCCTFFLFTGTYLNAQCGGIAANSVILSDQGTGPGLIAWTNPMNGQYSDNVRTSALSNVSPGSPQKTHFLYLRNFGYSLPGTATICGIVVAIEHRKKGGTNGAFANDYSVQLTNGSFYSANYAKTTTWGDTDEVFLYGSDTDNWGVNWTPSDVNQSGFGVSITAMVTAGSSTTSIAAEIDDVYIIIYTNAVLPVELTNFNAKEIAGNKVRLDWTTATETNNSFFVVQRSKDAITFEDVAHLKGAGTSLLQHTYSVTDPQPPSGMSYYRLTQVDMNGSEKVYPITQVYVNGTWGVDPMSQPGVLFVRAPQNNVLTQVDLINLNGEKLWSLQEGVSADRVRIDVANVPPGIYFVKATSGTEQFCAKTFVLKE